MIHEKKINERFFSKDGEFQLLNEADFLLPRAYISLHQRKVAFHCFGNQRNTKSFLPELPFLKANLTNFEAIIKINFTGDWGPLRFNAKRTKPRRLGRKRGSALHARLPRDLLYPFLRLFEAPFVLIKKRLQAIKRGS